MNMQIYEEASEWIILHRSDALDSDARRRFDTWLRESPQHLRAYLEMSSIWEDVPALKRDWNPDADQLIARAREDSNVFPLDVEMAPARQSVSVVTVPASRSARYAGAVAAMLVVLIGITGWFYLQRGIYITDTGEQRTIALTDGSTIELNAQTKIRVAYTDDQRTIELLRGQAFFKVSKDPQRPFIVEANTTKIRAVGTQFDVYRKSTGTQVTVVEGLIAVASEPRQAPSVARTNAETQLELVPGEILLSSGQQVLIAQNAPAPDIDVAAPKAAESKVTLVQPANLEAATAWTQQRLIFDFTPLTEVAEEFNRYNRKPLIVEDGTLRDFNVSGSFSSTDPTLLLRFLRDQPGMVVNETAKDIRISLRKG